MSSLRFGTKDHSEIFTKGQDASAGWTTWRPGTKDDFEWDGDRTEMDTLTKVRRWGQAVDGVPALTDDTQWG